MSEKSKVRYYHGSQTYQPAVPLSTRIFLILTTTTKILEWLMLKTLVRSHLASSQTLSGEKGKRKSPIHTDSNLAHART